MPTNSIDHFTSLFAHVPISLWEEGYSGIKQFFDELCSRGVTDLGKHFDEHLPGFSHMQEERNAREDHAAGG